MPLRVLLADDHAMFIQGVRSLLEREGIVVIGEALDGREAVRLAQKHTPDVAVLDVKMPLLNGLDAAREIRKVSAGTKIVILTRHTEEQYIVEALRAGVNGFLLKTKAAAVLVQTIKDVSSGALYVSHALSPDVLQAYLAREELRTSPLSGREREVLQLIAEGKSMKEIAPILGISIKTVETHRMRLMGKLDIHETAGLVRYAIRQGIIEA
jgi:two-component system, NarL family, response regulator NreC